MKKKWFNRIVLLFLVYCALMFLYIFYWSDSSIPNSLKGSVVDPTTFMEAEQLEQANFYSQIRNFLFFIITPLEWLFYFTILVFGASHSLEKWSKSKRRGFRAIAFVLALSVLNFLVFLPIKFYSYRLAVQYNISTQSVPAWFKDNLISFTINTAIAIIVALLFFALIRRFRKNWWFYAWLVTVPLTIFMVFLQPVVIDPLYNDFYPLKDKALEEKILALAKKADIPTRHVYEVNMSEKTTALNAYVTGIGDNSRIVLWDTTLEQLTEEEVLFVMAHEMAHYVEKDVYQSVGIHLAVSFIGLWLASWIIHQIVARKDNIWQIRSMQDFSVLPLLLLIVSILSFIYSPIDNSFSRMQERRADRYALELTQDAEAGISSFQKLSTYGLSQINPPYLVKIFRYGHPTMLERMQTLDEATD